MAKLPRRKTQQPGRKRKLRQKRKPRRQRGPKQRQKPKRRRRQGQRRQGQRRPRRRQKPKRRKRRQRRSNAGSHGNLRRGFVPNTHIPSVWALLIFDKDTTINCGKFRFLTKPLWESMAALLWKLDPPSLRVNPPSADSQWAPKGYEADPIVLAAQFLFACYLLGTLFSRET